MGIDKNVIDEILFHSWFVQFGTLIMQLWDIYCTLNVFEGMTGTTLIVVDLESNDTIGECLGWMIESCKIGIYHLNVNWCDRQLIRSNMQCLRPNTSWSNRPTASEQPPLPMLPCQWTVSGLQGWRHILIRTIREGTSDFLTNMLFKKHSLARSSRWRGTLTSDWADVRTSACLLTTIQGGSGKEQQTNIWALFRWKRKNPKTPFSWN